MVRIRLISLGIEYVLSTNPANMQYFLMNGIKIFTEKMITKYLVINHHG
jgi:hypothetical protein